MEKKSRYFIITDTHFFHKKIVDYCYRPENFDELIKKGLTMISENDIIIHIGDICMGHDQEVHDNIIKPLKCLRKILVRGNHDNKSILWYQNNGWDIACNGLSLNYAGRRVYFSHKPIKPTSNFDLKIHGHFHNAPRERWEEDCSEYYNFDFHRLLILENNNYQPILLDKLMKAPMM